MSVTAELKRLLTGLVVSALLLGACGRAATTPITSIVTPGPEDHAAAHHAFQLAVNACMARAGLKRDVEPNSHPLPAEITDPRTVEYRKEWGLVGGAGLLVSDFTIDPEVDLPSRNPPGFDAMTEAEYANWVAAEGECLNVVGMETPEMVSGVSAELLERGWAVAMGTSADLMPEVARWALCMDVFGYEFDSPNQAWSYAVNLYGPNDEEVNPDDVQVGVADAECSVSSGLWVAQDRLLSELDREATEQ